MLLDKPADALAERLDLIALDEVSGRQQQLGREQRAQRAVPRLLRERFVQLYGMEDRKEGVTAFFEKRKANWP